MANKVSFKDAPLASLIRRRRSSGHDANATDLCDPIVALNSVAGAPTGAMVSGFVIIECARRTDAGMIPAICPITERLPRTTELSFGDVLAGRLGCSVLPSDRGATQSYVGSGDRVLLHNRIEETPSMIEWCILL